MKSVIFFTTLVLLSCVLLKFVESCEEYPSYCYESPCYCTNQNQSISSLWGLSNRATPLISKFRAAINNLAYEVDKKQYAMLYAQTIWAVNVVTDFDASISPSCVFSNMISESLHSMRSGCNSRLKDVLLEYGRLCKLAMKYGIGIGLSAAGCPVHLENFRTCSENVCPIEQSFYDFLDLNPHRFPNEIHDLILCLSRSSNADDRLTALAAVASGTDISIKLFYELLKRKEHLESQQVKACSFDIPLVCCPVRKDELLGRVKTLGKILDRIVKKMLCHEDD